MTGMEHAIEQAARAEAVERWPALNPDDEDVTYPRSAVREFARGGFTGGAKWAVEYLRAQGLLAPGPLTEERGHRDPGGHVCTCVPDDPCPDDMIVHRYVTAWEPADGIGRSEGGNAASHE